MVASIADEMRNARLDFRRLVDGATVAELRIGSNGMRWTNDQLLFHMLFGYRPSEDHSSVWCLPDAMSRGVWTGRDAES